MRTIVLLSLCLVATTASAQGRGGGRGATAPVGPPVLLVPDRVWDAIDNAPHDGWVVLVRGDRIEAAGPRAQVSAPADATTIQLAGTTLIPGMIEGHSHLLLHPYNETSWDEQVLYEPLAVRIARATASARATLLAGFTTERDLGTEGAGYADVGLRDAIADGIIPGPRLIAVTRAIVATGAYGPHGAPEWRLPQGAEEATGPDEIARIARDQIGHGADWVKVYADYRWADDDEANPTFTEDELRALLQAASSAGRPVAAHAATAEGMRR